MLKETEHIHYNYKYPQRKKNLKSLSANTLFLKIWDKLYKQQTREHINGTKNRPQKKNFHSGEKP